jgi:hypothetical protein
VPITRCKNVGWAVPTDHLEPKQKDFKLLIRLPAVRCANAQSLPQSFAKCAVGDRYEPPEIFILLNRKWSVGIAHPIFLHFYILLSRLTNDYHITTFNF